MGKTLFYNSPYDDGHKNLAMDEWFLDNLGEDDMMLYFYVNENAVIIGKNQNPWRECNLKKMEEDKVQLVRRLTGGGAVYHDCGNLNFSFIAGNNRYDEAKQFELILNAVRRLGIPCEFSGKNDLKVEGMKFSGNAFGARKYTRQHHGTLLIEADLTKLSRYLNPDKKKLQAKGITSVRQKVCNLKEFREDITVEMMLAAIREAYREIYGEFEEFIPTKEDVSSIKKYEEKQNSWEWTMGSTPNFAIEIDERFTWGSVQLHINTENSIITDIRVFSDANDVNIADEIIDCLKGCRFDAKDMSNSLKKEQNEFLKELGEYILTIGI